MASSLLSTIVLLLLLFFTLLSQQRRHCTTLLAWRNNTQKYHRLCNVCPARIAGSKSKVTIATLPSLCNFRLYDGRILCEFMNKMHRGAIPEKVCLLAYPLYTFIPSISFLQFQNAGMNDSVFVNVARMCSHCSLCAVVSHSRHMTSKKQRFVNNA